MRSPRRASGPAAALLALLLGASACGIGGEPQPTRLEDVALPPEVVPEEATPADEEGPSTLVFFIQGETLVPVERGVSPTPGGAIRTLLEGPRDTEAAIGLRSAIPAGTTLLRAAVDGELATIDLSSSFSSIVGPEQVLALAQLVYTATSIPGITQAAFAIEGSRIDVARGDGSLSSGPVSRLDYPGIGPPG